MYVCATASIPIAVTLMMKGLSPGVAFVFLVTGPATNAASLAIIINTLGKKVAVTYLAVIGISSIAFGYLLNFFFAVLKIDSAAYINSLHMNHEHGVTEVDVSLSDNAAFVKGEFKMNELKTAVEEVGYRIA